MPDKEICTHATRFIRSLALSLTIALPGINAAHAGGGVHWDFRGFGSIAGAKTDEDGAEYRTDLRQGKGATSDLDWGLHSNLGAQLTADFGEQFSVTAQAVAKRRGDDDMKPELEWLYAGYRPQTWFDLRVGRLVMPEFLVSDYRSVGYAQPTIGPPAATYVYGSITSFDGAQLVNEIPAGDGVFSIQTSVGETEEEFYLFGPGMAAGFEMTDIVGLNMTYEWNNWLLRGAKLESEVKFDDPTFPALEAEFTAWGVQYDNGTLSATAESIDRLDVAESQYIMLGWRFGKWQPTVTVTDSQIVNFFGPDIDADTEAFALRYDAADNIAVKLQWEEVPPSSFYQWMTSDFFFFASEEEREVVSFSLDFIF